MQRLFDAWPREPESPGVSKVNCSVRSREPPDELLGFRQTAILAVLAHVPVSLWTTAANPRAKLDRVHCKRHGAGDVSARPQRAALPLKSACHVPEVRTWPIGQRLRHPPLMTKRFEKPGQIGSYGEEGSLNILCVAGPAGARTPDCAYGELIAVRMGPRRNLRRERGNRANVGPEHPETQWHRRRQSDPGHEVQYPP